MAKQQLAPIHKGDIRLRLLEEADLPITLNWRNQDHIRRWFIYSEIITPEQHRLWFENYCKRDNDFVFIIEETHEINQPVGQISLYDIDWVQGRAEYGRLMIGNPAARGKGIARTASEMLLSLGFEQFNLEEIYLEVFQDNESAIKVYRAVGFLPIGEKENLLKMQIRKEDFILQSRG